MGQGSSKPPPSSTQHVFARYHTSPSHGPLNAHLTAAAQRNPRPLLARASRCTTGQPRGTPSPSTATSVAVRPGKYLRNPDLPRIYRPTAPAPKTSNSTSNPASPPSSPASKPNSPAPSASSKRKSQTPPTLAPSPLMPPPQPCRTNPSPPEEWIIRLRRRGIKGGIWAGRAW